jgi:hypothetical protein
MGEVMRAVVLARMRWLVMHRAPALGSTFAQAVLVVVAVAVFSGRCLAQTAAPAPQNGGEIRATVAPIAPVRGVPQSQVSCRGQRNEDRPSLHCTVYFDTPIDVSRATVVDAGNKSLEWTPVFHPFDSTQDDTAFYILIDRRTARQADIRDLSDVFARARGKQQIAVSVFANDLTRLQSFTTDKSAVTNAFSRISSGGSASELFRHSLEAIRQLETVPAPRKVLLIASSGRSDDTAYGIDDVIKEARKSNVRIVALGYVDPSIDTPGLQILERLSNATSGFYYRADQRKSLPQDVRNTILTRFSGGGTLDATAPSKRVPPTLEVTLRHPNNASSSFLVNLAADASDTVAPTKPPENAFLRIWFGFRAFSSPWLLAAVASLLFLIVVAVILLLRRSRQPAPLASVDEIRKNLSAQREAIGLPEPVVPPAVPAPERAQNVEPVSPEAPTHEPTELQAPGQAPVIAWLEFNSLPGRVAIRKKHVTIGRELDNDIVTDPSEDTVSRHHAAVSVNNSGRFQISNRSREYRHTSNPIWINDKEMEHAELSSGDRVKLGTGSYGFVFFEVH